MAFPFLLILGVVLVAWSFLAVLGNERQRYVQDPQPQPAVPAPAEQTVGR